MTLCASAGPSQFPGCLTSRSSLSLSKSFYLKFKPTHIYPASQPTPSPPPTADYVAPAISKRSLAQRRRRERERDHAPSQHRPTMRSSFSFLLSFSLFFHQHTALSGALSGSTLSALSGSGLSLALTLACGSLLRALSCLGLGLTKLALGLG
jgi:hypothetical protein